MKKNCKCNDCNCSKEKSIQYEVKCPKCKSIKVATYRMPTGPVWCTECGYRIEHKEIKNPFYKKIKSTK